MDNCRVSAAECRLRGPASDSMIQSIAAFASASYLLASHVHLAILAAVALLGAVLAVLQRALLRGSPALRLGLGAVLLADTVAWYGYQLFLGRLTIDRLPLELCQFTLLLVIVALFTLNAAIFDVCYYLALAGTSMALLTPDLWERFPSLSTCQFFFAHGLVVASVLYLVWSGQVRPRRGSVLRAMLAVNFWAVVAGAFNWRFGTNYMYLRHKPAGASLLNFLGPWPWYIVAAEGVALVLFLILYLPFWRPGKRTA
jgi:hypothetical integral membrane protein (TIGR02206 family)